MVAIQQPDDSDQSGLCGQKAIVTFDEKCTCEGFPTFSLSNWKDLRLQERTKFYQRKEIVGRLLLTVEVWVKAAGCRALYFP